jgi:hypothetical protein
VQLAVNNASPEGAEATEGFGFRPPEAGKANHEPSREQGLDFLNSAGREAVAVLPTDKDANTAKDAMVEGEI